MEAVVVLARQEKVKNFVDRFRCKDGSYRWIEWRSAPSGKLIYAAARTLPRERKRKIDQEKQGNGGPIE